MFYHGACRHVLAKGCHQFSDLYNSVLYVYYSLPVRTTMFVRGTGVSGWPECLLIIRKMGELKKGPRQKKAVLGLSSALYFDNDFYDFISIHF
jgi:hypothetical protein